MARSNTYCHNNRSYERKVLIWYEAGLWLLIISRLK